MKYLLFFILSLFTLVIYSPGINEDFFNIDDSELILAPQLQAPISLQLLTTLVTPGNHIDFYPLRDLSYWVDIHLFHGDIYGVDASVYRLQNFFWFFLSGLIIFKLLLLLGLKDNIALFLSLIWIWNPIHAELFMWASARKDVMAIFFALLSAFSYLKFDKTSKKFWCTLCLCTFAASLLSKATFSIAPLALIFISRRRLLNGWLIAMGFLSALTQTYFYSQSTDMRMQYDWVYRLQSALTALGRGVLGWFWNTVNAVDIDNWGAWPNLNQKFLPVGVLVLFIGIAMIVYSFVYKKKQKASMLRVLCLGFVLSYIPISGLIFAHRNFYSVRYFEGPFLFLIFWWIVLFKNKINSSIVLMIIFGLCVFSSWQESEVWASSYGPFEKSLDLNQNSPALKYRLYLAYHNANRWGRLAPIKIKKMNQLGAEVSAECSAVQESDLTNGHLCLTYWLDSAVVGGQLSLVYLESVAHKILKKTSSYANWSNFLIAMQTNTDADVRAYAFKINSSPLISINRPQLRLRFLTAMCLVDEKKSQEQMQYWQERKLLNKQEIFLFITDMAKSVPNYIDPIKRCLMHNSLL